MSIFSKFKDIENQHNITLHEGEGFKQALYNGRLTDSEDCLIDKRNLCTNKHTKVH